MPKLRKKVRAMETDDIARWAGSKGGTQDDMHVILHLNVDGSVLQYVSSDDLQRLSLGTRLKFVHELIPAATRNDEVEFEY